jgi:hypothetical protein
MVDVGFPPQSEVKFPEPIRSDHLREACESIIFLHWSALESDHHLKNNSKYDFRVIK